MGRPNRVRQVATIAALLVASAGVAAAQPAAGAPVGEPSGRTADELRINQLQVVGSHNSYHLAASAAETAVRRSFIGDADDLMQYTHAPLPQQFGSQKVRQIELDVFRDDQGGAYSTPLLRTAAGHGPYDPAMDERGTKVLHVQDVDYRSNCLSLVACLEAVDTWSDAHPTHMPIAILVELKDDEVPFSGFPFVVPEKWTASAMDDLDAEIRSVLSPADLITPDDVRGDADTLEEAVTTTGWPTLEDSRGKVMLLMDNGGSYRTDYLSGHPNLEGRVMFTNSTPGNPDAAFVKMNEPRGNEDEIADLVEAGYVVRTRSDADTREAREGDTTGRDAAFASGAQWVSTDYPVRAYSAPFGTGYVVEIPGGTVARCNPVNAPPGCVSADIDTLLPPEEGPYVDFLYQELLGRRADSAGREHFTDRLESGVAREVVATEIAFSPEADRVNLGRIYRSYLGRNPDDAAGRAWLPVMRRSLDSVRVGVLASAEMYGRSGGTDEGWVTALYQLVLHRAPDPAGLAFHLDRLSGGVARSQVAAAFLRSGEARRVVVDDIVGEILDRAATPADRSAALALTSTDPRAVGVHFIATDEAHDLALS